MVPALTIDMGPPGPCCPASLTWSCMWPWLDSAHPGTLPPIPNPICLAMPMEDPSKRQPPWCTAHARGPSAGLNQTEPSSVPSQVPGETPGSPVSHSLFPSALPSPEAPTGSSAWDWCPCGARGRPFHPPTSGQGRTLLGKVK